MVRFNYFSNQTGFLKRVRDRARKHPDESIVQAARKLFIKKIKKLALCYGVIAFGVLSFLALLSFSSLLGGPYVLAQVILFLYLGTIALASLAIYFIWRKVKKKISKLQSSFEQSNVQDVEATNVHSSRVERIKN